MTTDTPFMKRLRALLAKARDPSVGEAEASAFMAKVQQMLERENLEMSDVDAAQATASVGEDAMLEKYDDPWRRHIAQAAARLYYCDMYVSWWWDKAADPMRDLPFPQPHLWRRRPSFVVVGQAHNVLVAQQMIRYLIDTTRRLSCAYSRVRAEQLAFERGCGLRLAQRLRELHVAARAASLAERARLSSQGQTLPALYDAAEEQNKVHMASKGLVKHGRGTTKLNAHSRVGMTQADGVSLAPQVGASSGAALLSDR